MSLAFAVGNQLFRGVADMGQDLVDHGFYGAGFKDIIQILLQEVGKADGADLSVFTGIFQCPPGFPVSFQTAVFILPRIPSRAEGCG